jgi:hypothetical protein
MRLLLTTVMMCALATCSRAQNQSGSDTSTPQSWKESTSQQSPSGNLNPIRTRESHSESGGRTIDKQVVERLGPDGRYEPYLNVERETVKVDSGTTRTVEHTYVRGPDGGRTLQQLTTEETRNLSGGEQRIARSVSNPDANGTLQVVRRQISDSKQIDANIRETKTTVLSPDLNGGLSPVAQVTERETKTGEHSAQFKKSTLLPDGNGGWNVGEVREGVIQGIGTQQQTRDEKVSRPDGNGNLNVAERTVTTQSQPAPGESRNTVEKYATDIPGTSGDGSLRLTERSTSTQQTSAAGTRTVQQTQQANSANPSNGMKVTSKTIDIVRPGSGDSTHRTTTVLSLDSKGDLGVVWVDTGKKDNQPSVKLDTNPAVPH